MQLFINMSLIRRMENFVKQMIHFLCKVIRDLDVVLKVMQGLLVSLNDEDKCQN